jgi:hypothetical protein
MFNSNQTKCHFANFDQVDMEVCNSARFWALASQKSSPKAIPNGQLDRKCLNQKVNFGPHLKLIRLGPKMPFCMVRFWCMKFIFLERGDEIWFVGKNPTKIGQMVHEIWPFEVHKFLKLN